jgi:hypothetical protein
LRYPESDRFVVGANLPWVGYGTDVGASAWFPAGGLSARPDALEVLDRTFAALASDGMTVVRTFLMCDLRSGVRFDRHGVPAGLDDAVFPDIDALLAAARRHRIRLMPVLLDFHLCGARRIADGVQLGGRTNLIANLDARQAFLDVVLRPILERYGDDEETIAAWDLMNEPEWCLAGGPLGRRRSVAFDTLQRFLADAAACVRASARQPVTVGCAGTTRLDMVRPLNLDFYQIHWYENFGWAALERPVTELDLGDAPIILGEFPGRTRSMTRVLDTARRAGYAAALVWSVLSGDDQSAYPPDLTDWVSHESASS